MLGGFDHLFHQAQLIVRIEDRKIMFEADEFGVAAQDLGADRMERAEPRHAFDHAADEFAGAVDHLARGLVGERHRQDLAGPGFARGEEMGEAGGQHARLAGAGAGQHQDGAVEREHRFALLGIEAAQIGRFGRNGRLDEEVGS